MVFFSSFFFVCEQIWRPFCTSGREEWKEGGREGHEWKEEEREIREKSIHMYRIHFLWHV